MTTGRSACHGTLAAVAKVQSLGGSVVMPAEDTPYGRIGAVTDNGGTQFKLRTPPSA